jgi:DNA-binding beta-propeller fold protein YncE
MADGRREDDGMRSITRWPWPLHGDMALPPPAQTVYVSNERGNTVSVIDGATARFWRPGRWASGRAASP